MTSRLKFVSALIALVITLFPIENARATFSMGIGSGGPDEPYELDICIAFPMSDPVTKEFIFKQLRRFLALEDFFTSASFRRSIGTRHARVPVGCGAHIVIDDSGREGATTLVNCREGGDEADDIIATVIECLGGFALEKTPRIKKRPPLYTLKIPCRAGIDSVPNIKIGGGKLYLFIDGERDLGALYELDSACFYGVFKDRDVAESELERITAVVGKGARVESFPFNLERVYRAYYAPYHPMRLGSGGPDEPYELTWCTAYPNEDTKKRILQFTQEFLDLEDFLSSASFRKSIDTRHASVSVNCHSHILIQDSGREDAKTLVDCGEAAPREADEVIATVSKCLGGVARETIPRATKRPTLHTLKIPCRAGIGSLPKIEIDSGKLYLLLEGSLGPDVRLGAPYELDSACYYGVFKDREVAESELERITAVVGKGGTVESFPFDLERVYRAYYAAYHPDW